MPACWNDGWLCKTYVLVTILRAPILLLIGPVWTLMLAALLKLWHTPTNPTTMRRTLPFICYFVPQDRRRFWSRLVSVLNTNLWADACTVKKGDGVVSDRSLTIVLSSSLSNLKSRRLAVAFYDERTRCVNHGWFVVKKWRSVLIFTNPQRDWNLVKICVFSFTHL